MVEKEQIHRKTEYPMMKIETTRAIQEMVDSNDFARTLFDPEEVTLADLSEVVSNSTLLDGADIDEVAVNVVAYSNYVFVTP